MNLETFNIKVRVQADQAKKSINDVKKDLNATTKELYKLRDAWKVYNDAYEKGDRAQLKSLEKQFTKKFGSKWTDLASGKTTFEELNSEIAKNEKATEKANSKTSKFIQHAKKIAASVLIWRTLSAAIRKCVASIKEGVTNLYSFQKAQGGGSLSDAMDKITSKVTALKNAFGAFVANFITAAEPFITDLLDKFVQLLNKASAIVASLFGYDSYWEASADIMDSWKKNNEETRQLISGIDSLNNIQTNASALYAENGKEYFRKVKLDENNDPLAEFKTVLNEMWQNVKDWWNTTVEPFFVALWNEKIAPALSNLAISIIDSIVNKDSYTTGEQIALNGVNFFKWMTGQMTWDELWKNAQNYARGTPGTDPAVNDIVNPKSTSPYAVTPRKFGDEPSVEEFNSRYGFQSYGSTNKTASIVAQCTSEVIKAIVGKDMTVVVGDDTVGTSANRANNDSYKLTGVGYV